MSTTFWWGLVSVVLSVVAWLILTFVFGLILYKIFEKPEKVNEQVDDAVQFSDAAIAAFYGCAGGIIAFVVVGASWVFYWFYF